MRTVNNRLLVMITLIFVIGALGMLVRRFGSMEWIVENETRMRDFVQLYQWQGWLLGLAIYTAFSLVPGTVGKAVIFGWIFGFWQAVAMVEIGLTVAALCGFFVSRFLFRDMVKSRFPGLVGKLDRHLDKDCAFYLTMMRLAHVPYSIVNYCAGATSVRVSTFAWTTTLGILPGTMIFVFVGTRIPTLASISEYGVWQLVDPFLFAILAATIVFPVLIRWAATRFRSRDDSDLAIELAALEDLGSWPVKRQTNGADNVAN
jgi:uncharacterized membrane protein YdjX (TVP38/TMEM64 family)